MTLSVHLTCPTSLLRFPDLALILTVLHLAESIENGCADLYTNPCFPSIHSNTASHLTRCALNLRHTVQHGAQRCGGNRETEDVARHDSLKCCLSNTDHIHHGVKSSDISCSSDMGRPNHDQRPLTPQLYPLQTPFWRRYQHRPRSHYYPHTGCWLPANVSWHASTPAR